MSAVIALLVAYRLKSSPTDHYDYAKQIDAINEKMEEVAHVRTDVEAKRDDETVTMEAQKKLDDTLEIVTKVAGGTEMGMFKHLEKLGFFEILISHPEFKDGEPAALEAKAAGGTPTTSEVQRGFHWTEDAGPKYRQTVTMIMTLFWPVCMTSIMHWTEKSIKRRLFMFGNQVPQDPPKNSYIIGLPARDWFGPETQSGKTAKC